jgi:DUF4097 and DUF4098 domain-containing protein YvlB
MTTVQTYLTPNPITCEVRNASGAVTVELTDSPTTTVELVPSQPNGFFDDVLRTMWGPAASAEDVTEAVIVEFNDDKLIVDTEPARRQFHTGFIVRISAPSGSGIRTRSESANVAVRGVPDKLEVKTASGTVDVSNAGPQAVLRTVSGDIAVRDVENGTLDLAAVSGSLSVALHPGVAAKVDLATVAGRARTNFEVVSSLDGSSVTIKGRTVSGDVELVSGAS